MKTKVTPVQKMIKRLEKKFRLKVMKIKHIKSDWYDVKFETKNYYVVCHL